AHPDAGRRRLAGELPLSLLSDGTMRSRASGSTRTTGTLSALAALLLMAAPGPACALELTGKVTDASGQPLDEAVVFVERLPEGVEAPPGPGSAAMDQVQKQFV